MTKLTLISDKLVTNCHQCIPQEEDRQQQQNLQLLRHINQVSTEGVIKSGTDKGRQQSDLGRIKTRKLQIARFLVLLTAPQDLGQGALC